MPTDEELDPRHTRDDADEIPDEIDFSQGVRGKYHERFKNGYRIYYVSDEEDRKRQARAAAGDPDGVSSGSQIARSNDVQGGTPVFAGTRVPIVLLFDHIETDAGLAEFLRQHPTVTRDQVLAVLDEAKDRLLAESA